MFHMKLFGIELFNRDNHGILGHARNEIKESNYLPDFHRAGVRMYIPDESWLMMNDAPLTTTTTAKRKKPKKTAEIAEKDKLTPKKVYEMKMLHEGSFSIPMDEEYVDGQIKSFKERLSLLKSSDMDMGNGVKETASILIRLQNRKNYDKFKYFFDMYPYAKTTKIQELLKEHDYLKMDTVEQFVPDLPQEAIDTMTVYKKKVDELCNKYPIFYIIADKKDFQKTQQRRDPILLAQSPFGHFWQILGAWDKEMLLLDEL